MRNLFKLKDISCQSRPDANCHHSFYTLVSGNRLQLTCFLVDCSVHDSIRALLYPVKTRELIYRSAALYGREVRWKHGFQLNRALWGWLIHVIWLVWPLLLGRKNVKIYIDWDGWCHGDYVPFRFQMSHWERLSGDYVPLLSWNMKAGNDSLHTESSHVQFKFSIRWQCRIHIKVQLDVGVSPLANIMTFRPGLIYLTFDLDPRDLWPWPMTFDLEHYL